MRLLLAEDERELNRALVAILGHAGYEVDSAADGEEALYDVANNDYDVIVLDIMMPKVDGLEVLRRLRADGCQTPVLMLTAKSEVRDRVEGLDAGANDYLTKPFAAAELLARLRVLTRANPAQASNELRFADLTLDVDGRRITCGDRTCDLTRREYQTLELLMRQPGDKISVDQFMRKVWGGLTDAEPSVVWVNISNLRKRIASVGAHVRISAARNVGYFREEVPDEADGASEAGPAGSGGKGAGGSSR